MSEDRTARVLGSVREGWHGLAGGDAASCPGCPVCALTEQAGRLDPATAAHLQAAAGHLAAAGRELLAVLGGAPAARPGPSPSPTTTTDPSPGPGSPRPSDPGSTAGDGWTKIDVSTRPIDEEHS